ncbi:PPE family protein [Mycobacterium sp.]|uniref:PPE family protein n=1 Tax=Mycobacterium sp. TaxID=1785 RepID=UPI003F951956
MDFGALPPEVNSGRMYVGPGPATLLTASAGWDSLAAELLSAAGGYQAVITGLTDESWTGPSSVSMVAAVTPYLQWMRTAAAKCEEAATRATDAAAAYETAFAMTVPPPAIVANRVRLATLIATNFLGQNTPVIAATEAEYSEMWAQDASAMYNYAASAASASAFKVFTSPPQTTNPSGLVAQAGAIARAAGAEAASKVQTTTAQLICSMPQALQSLATPGAASPGSSGVSAPISALSSLTGTSGKTATKSASAGLGTLPGLVTNLASAQGGNSAGLTDTLGLGSHVIGLGSDGTGFGADAGGLGFDAYGLSLDFQGADSILGAQGAPGLGDTAAGLGQAASLCTLSVPPSWADALSVATPAPVLDANVMPGGWGAMPSAGTGTVSKLPLGAMVGREPGGAVQRIGFRPSLIPHSPVAG